MMLVAVGAAAILIIAVTVLYNGLVAARQQVREAWSSIDVQLQRRAALIPNLVEAVRGYAEYERETMQKVVEARGALSSSSGPRAAAAANETLTSALQRLYVVAEAYPELKANERFAQLQTDLADTENTIASARNYYNGAVELHNIRVESFPAMFLARVAGFRSAEFFGGG